MSFVSLSGSDKIAFLFLLASGKLWGTTSKRLLVYHWKELVVLCFSLLHRLVDMPFILVFESCCCVIPKTLYEHVEKYTMEQLSDL